MLDEAEFTEANFEAPHRQLREERQRRSLGCRFLAAQRNDLMPHQTSDVGSLAKQRIPDDVQIRESRKSERLPDAVPAGGGVLAAVPQGSPAGAAPRPAPPAAAFPAPAPPPAPRAAPPVGPRWMIPTEKCSLPMSTTLMVRSVLAVTRLRPSGL